MKKTVIIGAGAAGLCAAGAAAENGNSVIVIERNARPARKVMITGKGRCNITNSADIEDFINNVPTNPRFFYCVFNKGIYEIFIGNTFGCRKNIKFSIIKLLIYCE